MGLPEKVFYGLREAAERWDANVCDLAGWASTGSLQIVTGIPFAECGDRRVAGLVEIQPMDLLPLFRRCGKVHKFANLHRIRPLGEPEWLCITAPRKGIPISINDMIILASEVKKFETTYGLFDRSVEDTRSSEDGEYDWPAMNIEITRRVFEQGLPASQAEWIRELQD